MDIKVDILFFVLSEGITILISLIGAYFTVRITIAKMERDLFYGGREMQRMDDEIKFNSKKIQELEVGFFSGRKVNNG